MTDGKETKMENLALWSAVEKTDPKFTKEFKRGGGFNGTAINPTWMVKKATETFGPIGIGWGYTIQDESYQKGHDFLSENGQVLGTVIIHKLRLEVWYIYDGSLGRVTQFGQTEFVGRNKYGMFTDEEAPKKSLTDALTKCLSLIGFAADVHMGLFDDNKYVNSRRDEEANANTPTEPKPNGNGHAPKDSRDAAWKGPLTKTDLGKKLHEITREVLGCADADQLDTYLGTPDVKAVLEQLKVDLPKWWDNDNNEHQGIKQRIEGQRKSFTEPQPADWKTVAEDIKKGIDACVSLGNLNAYMESEEINLAMIKGHSKTAHEFLINRADARRSALAQAPAGKAA